MTPVGTPGRHRRPGGDFASRFSQYVEAFTDPDLDRICSHFHPDAAVRVADRAHGQVMEWSPRRFYTALFSRVGSAEFQTDHQDKNMDAGWITVSGRWMQDDRCCLQAADFFMARGDLTDHLSVVWWS
ncbi:MAG: hypothetical protein MK116_10515 [Phycisphaerales bacterium]|nr:hypothetical protein [Phycisphaerales bacterium]